ncbi:MAG: SpoIIE family protein phosphatase [bacterium]
MSAGGKNKPGSTTSGRASGTRKTAARPRRSEAGRSRRTGDPLANRVQKLEFLAKSSRLLNSTLDYDHLLGLIMTVVKEALDVETVSVICQGGDGKHLVFEMARGKHGREIAGLKVPLGTGVVGWVAKNKKPIVINDVAEDKRFKPMLADKLGITARSIMSIPLKRGSRFIGVLEAVNRRTQTPFTDDDLEIFLALGNHIAAAMENARLYREAERKRLESSLLYNVSVKLGRSLSLDDVLEEILKSLKKLIDYDAAAMSRGSVIGLFNLESDDKNAYREKDLRLLNMFASQAAVSIERANLYEEQRVKREIERELKLARTVQQFFTPTHTRKIGPFTLAGRNYPSLELSGDYFDFFPLKKPHAAFAIADVAGKGVPASIIMSSFRAILHTAAPYCTHARDITQRANEILLESVRRQDFVTAFIGVLNYSTGEITYCNAGHNPPILMRMDGTHELLEIGGPILGVFDDAPLEEGTCMLDDGLLFCYTDGTLDAVNSAEEPFGMDRLLDFLRSHRRFGPKRICTGLRQVLVEHVNDMPQLDDMTFLALKK